MDIEGNENSVERNKENRKEIKKKQKRIERCKSDIGSKEEIEIKVAIVIYLERSKENQKEIKKREM